MEVAYTSNSYYAVKAYTLTKSRRKVAAAEISKSIKKTKNLSKASKIGKIRKFLKTLEIGCKSDI